MRLTIRDLTPTLLRILLTHILQPAHEGGDDRPQTDSSNSSQKRSFKPKKTFDFENGDTALSEVRCSLAGFCPNSLTPNASFQIDRKGNMDGHCEYKFYTGATFSGKMRHGERFELSALRSQRGAEPSFSDVKQEWTCSSCQAHWREMGNQLSTQQVWRRLPCSCATKF